MAKIQELRETNPSAQKTLQNFERLQNVDGLKRLQAIRASAVDSRARAPFTIDTLNNILPDGITLPDAAERRRLLDRLGEPTTGRERPVVPPFSTFEMGFPRLNQRLEDFYQRSSTTVTQRTQPVETRETEELS
mmetsp:Transcript_5792/g.13351  ORF Transcript_5792/g.13351 Transcript_5792/m.13351 type:complete len:134 (+) Transcript_5792:648-1049(+)